MTVTRGQTLLLRLSNVSVVNFYTVRLLSLPMRVIAKGASLLKGPDGRSLDYRTSSITLGGGETTDVIVETAAAETGTYFLYTTNLNYLSNNEQDHGGIMIELNIIE
jgi:FtsP/CotA-like multicopper oxidase with cupredoxin domain